MGYKSALDNVNACVNWEAAAGYNLAITDLEQDKLDDPGNAAVFQAQIDGFKVALGDLGLDYDDPDYSTELSALENSCTQAQIADPGLATSSATVLNVATSVGQGAGLFFTWYKCNSRDFCKRQVQIKGHRQGKLKRSKNKLLEFQEFYFVGLRILITPKRFSLLCYHFYVRAARQNISPILENCIKIVF